MIKWIILALSLLIFFGLLGIFAFLLIVLFYYILKILKKDDELEKEEESEEKIIIELDEIIKKETARSFDANELETYKEIIYSGSQDEKIELIGMVVFNPSREYVSLIRQMLKDNDETVRILASNSLQKMENYFENKIDTLKNNLKKQSDKEEQIKTYLELINTYDSFIESNLLESFIISDYEDKIFKTFSKIKKLDNKTDIKRRFLHLSVKYNRFESIVDDLKKRIENYDKLVDKFLLAEIYFKQNKIGLIKDILKNIKRKEIKNIKYRNSYDYWMEYAE